MKDQYDLQISTENVEAVAAWLGGQQAGFSFDASGIPELKSAVKLAPDFALAHAALARQQSIHGQSAEANLSLKIATQFANGLSEREQSQIAVLSACMKFQPDALSLAISHIEKWSLDIFVLSLVVGPFGLLAFSGKSSWRYDCLALLERYQQYWPEDDWWYLSALGFSLAECGRLDEAQDISQQAWQAKPTGNCAHTLSHVHYEQGDVRTGKAFLKDWRQKYGRDSDMRHHLVWHDTLYQLDHGSVTQQSISELFVAEFDPKVSDPMPLTTLTDNASVLWRCCLSHILLDNSFAEGTLEYANLHFPDLGFIFVDVHRVFMCALIGEKDMIDELKADILKMGSDSNANYLTSLLHGATAFTQGNFQRSVACLEPIIDTTVTIGGSNPQRAIVEHTYLRAKQLAGGRL